MITAAGVAAAGQFLGGAGQIASALGVGGSKGFDHDNAAASQYWNLDYQRKSRQLQLEQNHVMAKQLGYHPLTMLGIPTAAGPSQTFYSGDQSSPDLANVGYGIKNMASALVKPPDDTPTPAQSALQDAAVRTAKANADYAEWRALGAQFEVSDRASGVGRVGLPPGAQVSNDAGVIAGLAAAQAGVSPGGMAGVEMRQTIDPPHPNILGHSLGAGQSSQRIVDRDGQLFSLPNPNVFDPEIQEFGTFHVLSEKYGVQTALKIMAALEQAPLAGGILGSIGLAGAAAYKYFAKQRADALKRQRELREARKSRNRGTRSYQRGWRSND